MDASDSFSSSLYTDQRHIAEGELAAFVRVVTESFGSDQARLLEEEWLEESDLMDSPPRSMNRNWHAATVAASARLENRLHSAGGPK